jgi:ribosomal protein S18 acetylase RimI-like enzyme
MFVSHTPPTAFSTDDRASKELRLEPLRREQRAAVERLLRESGFFRHAEIVVALEVIDAYLAQPDRDYTALGAFTPGGDLVGYVCYGPTPCTVGTYDLYWIAVATAARNSGVGTQLLQEVERRLARADARLVIIESSSQPLYEPTRQFYRRRGYEVVARVPDFYADGDDRVIFAKRILLESKGNSNG